jgi:hypothetical protein
MKAKEMMFCWKPNSDQIKVGPWPDNEYWSRGWPCSCGACYSHWHKMTHEQLKTILFIEAIHLIMRDKVCPDAVHREFYKIDEYRDGLSEDFPVP